MSRRGKPAAAAGAPERRVDYLRTLRESLALVAASKGLFTLVLGVSMLGALLTGVGDPVTLKWLIDSLTRGDARFFFVLGGLLLLLYTALRVVAYATELAGQRLKNRIQARLVGEALRRFFRLGYREVLRNDRGYFISRIYDEPARAGEAVDLLVRLFSSVTVALGAIVVCLVLSWQVSLFLSLVVPVLLVLADRFGRRIRSTSLRETEAEARLREGLGRAVESFKTVRLFGLQKRVETVAGSLTGGFLDTTFERQKTSSKFQMLSGTFLSYAEMAVLVGTGFLVLQDRLTVGGLFGFMTAYWRVVNSIRGLAGLMPSFARLSAQLERLREFGAPEPAAVPSAAGARLELRGAAVGYDDKPVLEDLDLLIRPGERILILGPNGSGKSTLAHLICGFLEASAGSAVVPGPARTSALLWPFGFIPGTVRENLALDSLGEPARRTANEMLARFGLDGELERDPAALSEGQKRKLQVIMVLLKDADYYVFDEPLASVDVGSKPMLVDAILGRTEGRGLVMILHGEEHLRERFDRVLDLGAPAGTAALAMDATG